jgi:Calcineurin-like phosphoesterase/GTPase-associated adaptor domain
MSLRLLHLSDIHFGGYGPEWDEDEDQREQLLEDVRGLVAEGGRIDGILVGGDVAHSGQPEEYARARDWLDALVQACGCPAENVWVVPGNHDVDRARVAASAILQEFRGAVRASGLSELDEMLRRRLAQDPCGDALLATLDAYNEFALPWGCHLSAHRFHWKDATLRLGGKTVMLWGMNSVLVSDGADCGEDPDRGTKANLLLGTHQCRMPRSAGTIRIALVHHPPNWLRDWTQVKPYVDRAHVVLFGHEHCFVPEQQRPGGTVYVRAGAVGPEQGPEWAPSYNLLRLEFAGGQLQVHVEPRSWIVADTCFGLHDDGKRTFTVVLDEPPSAARETSAEDSAAETVAEPANATPLSAGPSNDGPRAGDAEGAARRRELVFRYLSAARTRREEIARELGVFEEDDVGLPEGEFYAAILRRIRDRELIDQLARELGV